MAVMLLKNDLPGKPTRLTELKRSEVLECDWDFCHVLYTMAWGINEQMGHLDLIRKKAIQLIHDGHPNHAIDTYPEDALNP